MGGLSDARLMQELAEGLVTRNGTSPNGLVKMLERVNIPLAGPALGSAYSDADLQQHLRQGHKLMAQVEAINPKTGERSAHYILVKGMTPEGNYRISDPLAKGPQVVTPEQLHKRVSGAPPDGGLLIPVATPRHISDAPRPTHPRPARQDELRGEHVVCGPMARSEERNDFELDIDYICGEAEWNGRPRPLIPERLSVHDFVERLLTLKQSGCPRALRLLSLLQASPFPRDQRVCERVMWAELRQPGIGKKLLGDPC
jgi:hypothetical protein